MSSGTVTLNSSTLIVAGDFTNTDTISASTGTVKFTQTAGTATITFGGYPLYNVEFDDDGNTEPMNFRMMGM